MTPLPDLRRTKRTAFVGGAVAVCVALIAGCGKEAPKAAEKAPIAVTVLTVERKDVPVTALYVAQTQSSQAVNIQARVSGFLDKRVYTEGAVVKTGQVLFQMDQKPFQAQVDAQNAALQRNQAALEVAKQNLARTKPLAQLNALSQKDLDDAQGQYEQAAAAVEQSKAQLTEAKLNLSYTTIVSPVDGISSYAVVADGTYLSPTNAQLTTVSVLTPMWINFSVSENEMERIRNDVRSGQLKLPDGGRFVVQVEMVDGNLFPVHGRDHVRRSVVQPEHRHLPAARDRQQSGRRAASEPVRPRAPDRRHPPQRHRRPAARRPAEREGPFRLGGQPEQPGGTATDRRRRVEG